MIAVSASSSTLIATPADAKRALKECDSAWLRLAPALACFEPPALSEWEPTIGETVVVVAAGGEDAALPALARCGYIGFVSIESSGDDEDAAMRAATVLACHKASWLPRVPSRSSSGTGRLNAETASGCG